MLAAFFGAAADGWLAGAGDEAEDTGVADGDELVLRDGAADAELAGRAAVPVATSRGATAGAAPAVVSPAKAASSATAGTAASRIIFPLARGNTAARRAVILSPVRLVLLMVSGLPVFRRQHDEGCSARA